MKVLHRIKNVFSRYFFWFFFARLFDFFLYIRAAGAPNPPQAAIKLAPQAKILTNMPEKPRFSKKKCTCTLVWEKKVLAHRSQKKYFHIQKSTCTSPPLIEEKSEKNSTCTCASTRGGIDRRGGILQEILLYAYYCVVAIFGAICTKLYMLTFSSSDIAELVPM